jgi:signal recognition particle receptor subunit beta
MGNVVRSRILCLGIDGAGKTAFIDKVQHPDQDIPTSPTDAYVVRDVKVKGVVLSVWDVAGRSATRSLWKHYFAEGSTDAVIWVVDSSSSDEKLEESKQALASVLMDPNLAGTFLASCVLLSDCVFVLALRFSLEKIIYVLPGATVMLSKRVDRFSCRLKLLCPFYCSVFPFETDPAPYGRTRRFLAIPPRFFRSPYQRDCFGAGSVIDSFRCRVVLFGPRSLQLTHPPDCAQIAYLTRYFVVLGVLLFVLANKQDAAGAKEPDVIAKLLGLSGQEGKRPWFIRGISARTGDGAQSSIEQLELLYS